MNTISWFEVPVTDMKRAIRFYNTVFGFDLQINHMGPLEMAWFPSQEGAPGAAGSLVKHKMYAPSKDGVLVYFACDDVAQSLKRVGEAGGEVLQQKTLIKEDVGYMGILVDTEGNRIALHSRR